MQRQMLLPNEQVHVWDIANGSRMLLGGVSPDQEALL
jgi:hypothetical protein